jgi:hypothetical protein
MRIDGIWLPGDDGEVRPILPAKLLSATGAEVECQFLIDTGADHTVLSAELLTRVGLPTQPASRRLGGIGGAVEPVSVFAQVQLLKTDGEWIQVGIECYAFQDPNALDMSVAGRDLLNLFSLISDRRGNVVCLIGYSHRYVIQEG